MLDKLNEEFGTDVHFPTNEEIARYGLDIRAIDMSIVEYESYLRQLITANLAANREATIAQSRVMSRVTSKDLQRSIAPYSTVYNGTQSSYVSGAKLTLHSYVENIGYWSYADVEFLDCTTVYSGSTGGFHMETTSLRIIDSRRTCAATARGYATDKNGTMLDSNASRYKEFSASSASRS